MLRVTVSSMALPDAAVPETVDDYVAADNPAKLFMLGDVALWILVHGLDASDVGCIEHREADCEVMPQLERGVDAKVGQALPLFLAHMVAVRALMYLTEQLPYM